MNNFSIVIWLLVVCELLVAVNLFKNYLSTKNTMSLCVFLISVGLMIDALFIVIGGLFDNGLPENVSRIRFICHGGLIPLILPICGYSLKAGKRVMNILWGLTAVIVVLGVAQGFALNLELVTRGDIVRHVMADSSPAWARAVSRALSFGTVLPLIGSGIAVWVKQKTPYLFLSGVLMFAFAAIGPATGHMDLIFLISMFGEVFMILFAFLYIINDDIVSEKEEQSLAA